MKEIFLYFFASVLFLSDDLYALGIGEGTFADIAFFAVLCTEISADGTEDFITLGRIADGVFQTGEFHNEVAYMIVRIAKSVVVAHKHDFLHSACFGMHLYNLDFIAFIFDQEGKRVGF